jgi:hypothetical protein
VSGRYRITWVGDAGTPAPKTIHIGDWQETSEAATHHALIEFLRDPRVDTINVHRETEDGATEIIGVLERDDPQVVEGIDALREARADVAEGSNG